MPNNGFKAIYQKIWGPSKLLGPQARARFALWLLRPWKLQIDTALIFDQYIQISEFATRTENEDFNSQTYQTITVAKGSRRRCVYIDNSSQPKAGVVW